MGKRENNLAFLKSIHHQFGLPMSHELVVDNFAGDLEMLRRFLAKVRLNELTDCWMWQGAKAKGGYGKFYWNGKLGRAHRFSLMMLGGGIPEGMDACHKCDTPACVNPAHLFAGTKNQNMRDMAAKGRGTSCYKPGQMSGERNTTAKLTKEKVMAIRERYASGGISKSALARMHGISLSQVCNVIAGRNWAPGF